MFILLRKQTANGGVLIKANVSFVKSIASGAS